MTLVTVTLYGDAGLLRVYHPTSAHWLRSVRVCKMRVRPVALQDHPRPANRTEAKTRQRGAFRYSHAFATRVVRA